MPIALILLGVWNQRPMIDFNGLKKTGHRTEILCDLYSLNATNRLYSCGTVSFEKTSEFLLGLFASSICKGIEALNLILDNGPTHAPKQLGAWIASLELSFVVRTSGCRSMPVGSIKLRLSSAKCNASCSRRMIFPVLRRSCMIWRRTLPN
jgi:hypothetical protein